jgi:mRNA interferase RelE/StbE
MYRVEIYKDAAKYYKRLDDKVQVRVNTAIEEISESPSEGIHIKKLKGSLAGKYRFDVGGLRIIYSMMRLRKLFTSRLLVQEEIFTSNRITRSSDE